MRLHDFKLVLSCLFILAILFIGLPVFAAKPLVFNNQPLSRIPSFINVNSSIKQISQKLDFNQTLHIRMQQMYAGYPVYGANAIMHVPHANSMMGDKSIQAILLNNKQSNTINGKFYENIEQDLQQVPHYIFEETQAKLALQRAVSLYQKKSGNKDKISDPHTQLLVYIDSNNKANWVYRVDFTVDVSGKMPAKPIYILDALKLTLYQAWDDMKTALVVNGGGYGGNEKIGRLTYDALTHNAPVLNILRDNKSQICYLANGDVTVKDARRDKQVVQFNCETKNQAHNNLYWDADFDAVNGAYSPSNDALYIGKLVKDMYQKWYGVPVLTNKTGNPMMLTMVVHENMENAYWNGHEMIFGDGKNYFYPMVSLGVGAHEIAHGFTEQNSNLNYEGQSGGINESFSDMAAQAAEFYVSGHNDWHIGSEITKTKNTALRYMDEPTKDCQFRKNPGNECSISHVKDFHPDLDVHYSSGIFNKVFYLLATTQGWSTKKAFDVMMQANSHYWTSTETYLSAACGVVWAARDYGYSLDAVNKAMSRVGINTAKC